MKNILTIALTLLLTQVALAHAEKVVAEVKSVDAQINSVQLTDAKTLLVTRQNGRVLTMKLSPTNADTLSYAAQSLGGVELAQEHHTVICMMMQPAFAIQNLYVADEKSGELKMVLSYRSCAIADSTFPKDDYAQKEANSLKDELVVLARQLAGI